MSAPDIVTDVLDRAEAAVREFVRRPEFAQMLNEMMSSGGGMEQRLADSLAQQIQKADAPARLHWGRDQVYVPAKPPKREEVKRRAVDEVRKGDRVVEVSKRTGISRASLYRMLKG